MRSLTGYLKKILLAFSLFFPFFLYPHNQVLAEETPFDVSSSFVHKVNEKSVTTELTLHLTTETTRVLSIYTASIQANNIKASCYNADGSSIKCGSYNRTSTTDVQMDLKNRVITSENPLDIKIIYSYELQNDITYSFPSKVLDAKTTEVKIIYPKERGDFSWSSEGFASKEQRGDQREVAFKNPTKDTISIFFDKHIQYFFTINRQFNNANTDVQTFELTIPLDDSTQIVLWENIDPLPTSAIQDEDGNYILKYLVKSGESVSVKLSGYIFKERSESSLDDNWQPHLSATDALWEIRDGTETKRLATFMKDKGLDFNPLMKSVDNLKKSERELFYKFLYQYVIYRLDYPKEIVLGVENSARLGANYIVENALTSTPVDYADFYMALLRNYSIPSRMVIGYISNVTGYTTDGFYHYWVEYYDQNKEQWVQVDPFLEEYFGYNIFESELNDHIAILKRGKSPMAPTLTFYSPTDFIVQMDNKKEVKKEFAVNSNLNFDEYDTTKQYAKAYITTSNTGNVIISKINLGKSNIGNIGKYVDSVNNSSSQILLPKQTNNIQLNIPVNQMLLKNISISTQYVNNAGNVQNLVVTDEIPDGIPLYTRILAKVLSLVSFGILLLLLYTIFKLIQKRKWIQQSLSE